MSNLHPYYQPQPCRHSSYKPAPRPTSEYGQYTDRHSDPVPIPPPRPSSVSVTYPSTYSDTHSHDQPSSSWARLGQFPSSQSQESGDVRLMRPESAQSRASFTSQDGYQTHMQQTSATILNVSSIPPPAASHFDARPMFYSTPSVHEPPLSTSPKTSSLSNVENRGSPISPHLPFPADRPTIHPFPTAEGLLQAAQFLERNSDADQIAWAQDVWRLVERHWNQSSETNYFERLSSPPSNSLHLSPDVRYLLDTATTIIIAISTSDGYQGAAALALYLKGRLLGSGVSADLPRDNRQAFIDYKMAAKLGEARAWYQLGKDYEGVNDTVRARDCFDRGAERGDCECALRMALAHLLGQLDLPRDPSNALSLFRQASETSTIDFPQPAYVYGMLLAGELSLPTEIPPYLILPSSSPITDAFRSQQTAARKAIERAAYLNYPPALYKAGYMYEHAALGCTYDPQASVAWYAFASVAGEAEADMALSKWFLCGAEGYFGQDESNARMYAEKAARKGNANGCFALGYYFETGVGGSQDLQKAVKWYKKAAELGNSDAPARLTALTAPIPNDITMQDYGPRIRNTIVRTHTIAKIRSDQNSYGRGRTGGEGHHPMSSGAGDFGQITPIATVPQYGIATVPQGHSMGHGLHGRPSVTSPPQSQLSTPRPGEPVAVSSLGNDRQPGPSIHSQQYPAANTSSHPRRPSQQPAQGQGVGPIPKPGSSISSMSSTAGSALSNLPYPATPGPKAGVLAGAAGAGGGCQQGDKSKKGAETFAEMGFKSKPVEQDNCVIM